MMPRACDILLLSLWAWAAKRTKGGERGPAAGGFATVLAATPPPNPLPQGEGENVGARPE